MQDFKLANCTLNKVKEDREVTIIKRKFPT